VKVVEDYEIYNFSVDHSTRFSWKNWRESCWNRATRNWNRAGSHPRATSCAWPRRAAPPPTGHDCRGTATTTGPKASAPTSAPNPSVPRAACSRAPRNRPAPATQRRRRCTSVAPPLDGGWLPRHRLAHALTLADVRVGREPLPKARTFINGAKPPLRATPRALSRRRPP
jgi:hypothetical protein